VTWGRAVHPRAAPVSALLILLLSKMAGEDDVPKQPLHPSIIDKLDPEYVEFHNKYLQYVTPSHTLPWDPASRDPGPATVRTESEPVAVGKTQDYEVGHARLRVYTPAATGAAPGGGWPVLVFIPGGGL
jgi:hypothetical protein